MMYILIVCSKQFAEALSVNIETKREGPSVYEAEGTCERLTLNTVVTPTAARNTCLWSIDKYP